MSLFQNFPSEETYFFNLSSKEISLCFSFEKNKVSYMTKIIKFLWILFWASFNQKEKQCFSKLLLSIPLVPFFRVRVLLQKRQTTSTSFLIKNILFNTFFSHKVWFVCYRKVWHWNLNMWNRWVLNRYWQGHTQEYSLQTNLFVYKQTGNNYRGICEGRVFFFYWIFGWLCFNIV